MAKQLPVEILRKECQREIQNFMLMSKHLTENEEKIEYCEDISAGYLLKYFPY